MVAAAGHCRYRLHGSRGFLAGAPPGPTANGANQRTDDSPTPDHPFLHGDGPFAGIVAAGNCRQACAHRTAGRCNRTGAGASTQARRPGSDLNKGACRPIGRITRSGCGHTATRLARETGGSRVGSAIHRPVKRTGGRTGGHIGQDTTPPGGSRRDSASSVGSATLSGA